MTPVGPPGPGPRRPDETYGHTPVEKMFAGADVYGIGFDAERAGRSPLRLAVIGAGGVAQSKWLPALRRLQTLWDPVELVGIADPAEAQGRKVQRLYSCPWYSDHRLLLAEARPQAVIVASPDGLHSRHARDVLELGVAALVEKPFATSLVDAWELCRLASENQTVLMAVANLRFAPPFRRARLLLADLDGFRPPLVMRGKMDLGYDYVDLLEGATVHLFDLARFFMGDVTSVEAHGVGQVTGQRPYPFRQAAITLEFASGSIAQLSTSSSALSLKPWLRSEVHGAGVWLAVDDVFELALHDSETGPTKVWRPVLANTLLFDEEFGGYSPQLEHFLQVVRAEENPSISGLDGYRAIELIYATHLAIANSSPVALPLDPERADHDIASIRARW